MAIQLSKHLVPGYREEFYIEFEKNGWLQECRRNETQILIGMLPHLKEKILKKFSNLLWVQELREYKEKLIMLASE